MPDARRKRGQRATTRRRLAVLGIAAFVLVDLALVAVALTREPTGLAADREPAPAASSAPAETTSTPTPSPTAPEAVPAVAPTRSLSAVDGQTAWRAQAGTCAPGADPAAAILETTTTGGSSWSSVSVSTEGAVAGVDRLQAADAATVFVVGPAGEDCSPAFAQTFTGGAAFQDYPDRLSAAWYVARTDTATVHSPSGDHTAPCPVIGLAVVSDVQAGVLCGDGTLHRTVDGAISWDAGTPVEGAVALTADAGSYLVASTGVEDCDGVAVSVVGDAAAEAGPVGCAPATVDVPGAVAVSAASGALWVWAGDTVAVSLDGGSTW